jgi:hypothetical protein
MENNNPYNFCKIRPGDWVKKENPAETYIQWGDGTEVIGKIHPGFTIELNELLHFLNLANAKYAFLVTKSIKNYLKLDLIRELYNDAEEKGRKFIEKGGEDATRIFYYVQNLRILYIILCGGAGPDLLTYNPDYAAYRSEFANVQVDLHINNPGFINYYPLSDIHSTNNDCAEYAVAYYYAAIYDRFRKQGIKNAFAASAAMSGARGGKRKSRKTKKSKKSKKTHRRRSSHRL